MSILGITRREKKRVKWIIDQIEVTDVLMHIKLAKWRWLGDQTISGQNIYWKGDQDFQKRPRRGSRHRWRMKL